MHRAFADKAVPQWIAEVKKHYGTEKTKYACVGYSPPTIFLEDDEVAECHQILLWSSICL